MVDTAQQLSASGMDVYFGVGAAKEPRFGGRARADDVMAIPGVWLDIDLKHDTHVQQDLPETIAEIEAKLPLLPSVLVHSGHGLHAYWLFRELWVFTDEQEQKRARKLLRGFQMYVKQRLGYKLDSTHDLARVLRVPGTQNYKADPVPVEILQQNDQRYNIDDIDQFTLDDVTVNDYAAREKFKRLPTDGDAGILLDRCAFVQHCLADAAILPETEWIAMITNVARCQSGPELVHELSKPYPRYSADETSKKIIHALNDMSPTTCAYIQKFLKFDGCPSSGCGVKSPCAFALAKPKNQEPEAAAVPPGTIEALTDLGNAERFVRMFGHKLRYCHQFGTWLIWDGVRHKLDEQGQVMLYAKQAIRSFHDDLQYINDLEERKEVFKHARKSESLPRMKAMIEVAQHMLSVHVDELDRDPWLLNMQNGVLDLKTGQLLPHDSARFMTKLAPLVYDPAAKCPRFEKFMNDVFDGNQNIIQFMQRLFGYSLTGDTSEQMMSFAWGSMGSNGKSTMVTLLLNMLGDYGETTQSETFTLKRNEGIPNDIARLRGARFVMISELKAGTKLNEALINQITGQDKLTARFLRQEFFSFMPAFKLMILTNHKPVLTGDDPALWRRIALIPFLQRFTGDRKDKTLPEKLQKEWSGILNWCIKGCLDWQQEGLNPPDEVVQATKEYQNESDVITNWLEDCCLVKPHLQTKSGQLFRNFEDWCEENGERNYLSRNKFSQKLVEKGFDLRKSTLGVRIIKGIGLIDPGREIDLLDENPY